MKKLAETANLYNSAGSKEGMTKLEEQIRIILQTEQSLSAVN